MEVLIEGRRYVLEKKEAIFVDFRRPHAYRSLSDDLIKWELIFDGGASRAYYDLFSCKWGNKFITDGRMDIIFNMIKTELAGTFAQDHKIAYLMQLLFCTILETYTGRLTDEIKRAIEYIYANYGRDMTVSEIAEQASLSRSYFTKRFFRETGFTPRAYLFDVRISRAQDYLLSSELSISEIAERCGFSSTGHFSKHFKEKIGKSPKSFRSNFRGTSTK